MSLPAQLTITIEVGVSHLDLLKVRGIPPPQLYEILTRGEG